MQDYVRQGQAHRAIIPAVIARLMVLYGEIDGSLWKKMSSFCIGRRRVWLGKELVW